jgi:type I restriction enzyme S subunit
MKGYRVCVPSQRALEAFNAVVEPVLQQVKTLALQSRSLRSARDLLLPRLMSGELAV